jgi:hypothetical protein
VDLTVVDPAQRNRELVAHFAPESWMLGKPEVMSVCRLASTNEAWLSADKFHMTFVAHPARLRESESTLIDSDNF